MNDKQNSRNRNNDKEYNDSVTAKFSTIKNNRNDDKITNYISRSAKIGKNVKIWHFAYIGGDTEIGDNVMIGSLTHVDYSVKIGENTRIEGSV